MEIIKNLLNLFFKLSFAEKHNILLIAESSLRISLVFISLFIIYIILFVLITRERTKIKNILNQKDRTGALLNIIDYKFHVKNIYITIFKVFLYIFLTIGFIIFLRVYRILYGQYSLLEINFSLYFSLRNLIILVLFLCFIGIIKLFLETFVFPDLLKLYLYFLNYYHNYLIEIRIGRFTHRFGSPGYNLQYIFNNLWHIVAYATDKERRERTQNFEKKYPPSPVTEEEKDFFDWFDDYYKISREILYNYIEKYPILRPTFKFIKDKILWPLNVNIKKIAEETAWLTIFFALIYDITQGKLNYVYYASIIYIIRITIRKVAAFVDNIDWGWDNILREYMYVTPYKPDVYKNYERIEYLSKIKNPTEDNIKESNELMQCGMAQAGLIEVREEFLEYLKNGLQIEKDSSDLRVRKVILIILSIIGFLYIYLKTNITMIFTQEFYVINISYILIILIICQIFCWYFSVIKKILDAMFWLLSIFIIGFTFIIFTKHQLPLMFADFILNSSYVKLIDSYTLQEKIIFIEHYSNYLLQNITLDLETKVYFKNVLKTIDYTMLLNNSVTIDELKFYCESLIQTFAHMEKCIYIQNIMESCENLKKEDLPQVFYFFRNTLFIFGLMDSIVYTYNFCKTTYLLLYDYNVTSYKIVKIIIKYFY